MEFQTWITLAGSIAGALLSIIGLLKLFPSLGKVVSKAITADVQEQLEQAREERAKAAAERMELQRMVLMLQIMHAIDHSPKDVDSVYRLIKKADELKLNGLVKGYVEAWEEIYGKKEIKERIEKEVV